ncbi:MAG TPA: MFS transporter [Candidatus Sulfotelmatobacter sp.]|nr:MFS transporter [Candidatus Sulfotelmatobacter sp.]
MEKMERRAFVASSLGWGLDGFDFTMFALALPALLKGLSISVADTGFVTTSSLIASALGGIIGGVLADRFGRARVLMFVIGGFSLFTGLTATAQSLSQLYLWRVLMGFTFGAEWPVGAALLAEYATASRRGAMLGWVQSSYALGWAASTLMYLLLFSAFPAEQAWRFLFLVGVLPALSIFYIRLSVHDRPLLKQAERAKNSFPLLFKRGQLSITILATMLGLAVQGIYYSAFAFLPLFLRTVRKMTVVGTASYVWVVILGSFIGYVLAGYIHDIIGRRPTFAIYFTGSALATALFIVVPIGGSVFTYVGISFLYGFFASGQAAGMGSFLAELFPNVMRGAGQGFAYNVGRGFGAFAPAFIGAASTSIGLGPAIIAAGSVSCVVGLIALGFLPETRGKIITEGA